VIELPMAAVLAFMLGSALAAAALKDVVASIVAFAGYSFGVAVLWALFRAPDVALTEAAVGAGITTVLFLLTIARTNVGSTELRFESVSPRSLLAAAVVAVTVGATVPALPAIGDPAAPVVAGEVSQYYIENSYEQTGAKNAVTAVLAAYRGFDTLGEATVVFSAGVAMLLVLGREEFL
jgi:multicomponent Na+:H+ antiporter subunit B